MLQDVTIGESAGKDLDEGGAQGMRKTRSQQNQQVSAYDDGVHKRLTILCGMRYVIHRGSAISIVLKWFAATGGGRLHCGPNTRMHPEKIQG